MIQKIIKWNFSPHKQKKSCKLIKVMNRKNTKSIAKKSINEFPWKVVALKRSNFRHFLSNEYELIIIQSIDPCFCYYFDEKLYEQKIVK